METTRFLAYALESVKRRKLNLSLLQPSQIRTMLLQLRHSQFTKHLSILMTGAVVGQVIGFAATPIISRLFSPSDFGAFGAFGAVSGTIGAVATLDYSQAVMLPNNREQAGSLFLLACLATVAVATLTAVLYLVFPWRIKQLVKVEGDWGLALLVLAILSAGIGASLQALCVREKLFRQTAISQFTRGIGFNAFQILAGTARSGSAGLIISSVLSDVVASMNLLALSRSSLRGLIVSPNWHQLKVLAFEYRDFPTYSATQNLLNAASAGLPVLLLAKSFGLEVAGAYAFGIRLLNAPMSLLLSPLRQVLLQRASEIDHQGCRLLPLFVRTTLGLFALGLLPGAIIMVWAPTVFVWLFGDQWILAGQYARYLVVWLYVVFSNLPAVLFARIIRIQRQLFIYNLAVLASRACVLVIGSAFLSAVNTIGMFSIIGAIMNLLLIALVGRAVYERDRRLAARSDNRTRNIMPTACL